MGLTSASDICCIPQVIRSKSPRPGYVKILCVLLATGSITSTAAEAYELADAAQVEQAIPEVIVTAQKREERAHDVPVSLTVLSSVALDGSEINSGTEIARQAPNLAVSLLGDESQPKFSLRGVAISAFNLNSTSPTGIFYDDVYINAQYLGGAQMYDMDRVEVLRGPQGTLFGKNTTAGAINFISRQPTFHEEGSVSLDAGSYGYREARGTLETPIIDNHLTVRVAFDAAHSDGYIKDLTPGESDLSNIDRTSGRLSLAYRDDGLTATLRLFRFQEDPHSIGFIDTGTGLDGTGILNINPRLNPNNGRPLGAYETFTNDRNEIQVRGTGGYITVVKDLGFATLTSTTSRVVGRFLNYADADGSIDTIEQVLFESHNYETSQDLHLTTHVTGPFNVIGGLYFFQNTIDIRTDYNVVYIGIPLEQAYSQKSTSYAPYLDATYRVGGLFTVYGGVRITDDNASLNNFHVTPIISKSGDLSYRNDRPSGRAGLQKELNADLMVYVQYARGYRSSEFNGGALANAPNVARPEELNAYETGLKSQWFERRLTLNITGFLYDFKDQQFVNLVSIGEQELVNAGRSRIKGAEIELAGKPIPALTLTAGLGLLDGRYTELVLNNQNLSGNQLIEAPRYTANCAVDYTMTLDALGSLILHTNASRIAPQYFDAQNSALLHVDSALDVGAGLEYRPPSQRYAVSVYGKNLTGNRTPVGLESDPVAMLRAAVLPYPRRFGIELKAQF